MISSIRRRPSLRLLRFDTVQRTAHWLNSLLFGIAMTTAIPLYFGSFFGIVFARHPVQLIHLWAGLLLPIPLLVALAGPWGARMRHDLRRINYWTRAEVRWTKTLGRSPLDADKFNPGQKAFALFAGASLVVMLATGSILQWFRFFPISWRTGATTTHDLFAFAIFAAIGGHIAMAVTHREPLLSMVNGTISEEWAASHAKTWLEEERDANHLG